MEEKEDERRRGGEGGQRGDVVAGLEDGRREGGGEHSRAMLAAGLEFRAQGEPMKLATVLPRPLPVALAFAASAAGPASAQPTGPRPSPKASVMQTIGTAEVTITYSRPAVKGRVVWGDLVPWDKVWRAGANEATTFAVRQDVTVDGQKLAGRYLQPPRDPGEGGVDRHLQPGREAVGRLRLQAKDDALRVKVKPQPAEMKEWLTFVVTPVAPIVGEGHAGVGEAEGLLHRETPSRGKPAKVTRRRVRRRPAAGRPPRSRGRARRR